MVHRNAFAVHVFPHSPQGCLAPGLSSMFPTRISLALRALLGDGLGTRTVDPDLGKKPTFSLLMVVVVCIGLYW